MMADDDAALVTPELDEHDIVAVEALLMRTIRAQDQTARDREVIRAANERIVANGKIRDGAYDALKVFGFEEPAADDMNMWSAVRELMGAERYNRAIAVARGAQFPDLLRKMGDDQPPSEALKDRAGAVEGSAKRTVPIRTAILEFLRARGEQGAKVGQVKQHLAEAYGITVHEKTPGMTLYRLLKEGLVTRVGRTWLVAPGDQSEESDFDALLTEPAEEQQEEYEEYEE